MDLKTLQYFLAVAEHLNFTTAARSLYISQPTLSLRISALEEELNCKLFERNKRTVFLTDAGAKMVPVVRQLFDDIEQINEIARAKNENVTDRGSLKIGLDMVDDEYSRFDFYKTLSGITNRYPGIRIEIVPVNFDDGLSALKQNDLDLCLLLTKADELLDPSFNAVTVVREEMIFATANQEGRTLEELQDKVRLTICNEPRWDYIYIDNLRNQGLHYTTELVKNNWSMQVMIRSQNYLSVMPRSYYEYLAIPGTQVFSMNPRVFCDIKAIWSKKNINPAIQLLLNEFAQAME